MFLLGFNLYGTLCASWTWLTISFLILGKFSTIISSNIFSVPFFFSSSGTPIIQMFVHSMLSQRSLRLSSVLFLLFSLFCSVVVISTILSSYSFPTLFPNTFADLKVWFNVMLSISVAFATFWASMVEDTICSICSITHLTVGDSTEMDFWSWFSCFLNICP